MYGVVVTYTWGQGFCQQFIELEHDFNTVEGWNEMLSKLANGDPDSNICVLYTHELRG